MASWYSMDIEAVLKEQKSDTGKGLRASFRAHRRPTKSVSCRHGRAGERLRVEEHKILIREYIKV